MLKLDVQHFFFANFTAASSAWKTCNASAYLITLADVVAPKNELDGLCLRVIDGGHLRQLLGLLLHYHVPPPHFGDQVVSH